jgi:hypothetical protein
VSSSIQVMTHPDGPRVNICVFRPAFVDFVRDRVPNHSNCRAKTHAAAGTCLVESTLAGRKTQTSFVLEADTIAGERFSPSPSVEATGHADTTTGSSSAWGGSGDGLFGGATARRPAMPARVRPPRRVEPTVPTGAGPAEVTTVGSSVVRQDDAAEEAATAGLWPHEVSAAVPPLSLSL